MRLAALKSALERRALEGNKHMRLVSNTPAPSLDISAWADFAAALKNEGAGTFCLPAVLFASAGLRALTLLQLVLGSKPLFESTSGERAELGVATLPELTGAVLPEITGVAIVGFIGH